MLNPSHGFRLSVSDIIFLCVCAVVTVMVREHDSGMQWVIPIAAGHFFLFCNLVRLRRGYELLWTAVFIANVTVWLYLVDFSWTGVLAVQLPVTVALIVAEARSDRYHGIGSRGD